MIFKMAFSVKAVGGALCGNIVASMMNAARYGVARGCFSNEAGMGSAAITAAAATTDNPVRQAYINMTGTFWDTRYRLICIFHNTWMGISWRKSF